MCLLITIVVVFKSFDPPGDFGGIGVVESTGLLGLFTNDSAALTTSKTYERKFIQIYIYF